MASLDDFSPEQRELLITLPYRVGLWVSQSDTTGGDVADEAEMKALETIVIAFAEDFCKSSFVEEIMRETLKRRDDWAEWQSDIADIPDECTDAVDMIRDNMSYKDVTSFKHNLIEIAVDVAMAFCETDINASLADRIEVYSRYYLKKIKSRLRNEPSPNLGEVINISRQEEKALSTLKEALRYGVQEGLEPEPIPDFEIEKMPPPPLSGEEIAQQKAQNNDTADKNTADSEAKTSPMAARPQEEAGSDGGTETDPEAPPRRKSEGD